MTGFLKNVWKISKCSLELNSKSKVNRMLFIVELHKITKPYNARTQNCPETHFPSYQIQFMAFLHYCILYLKGKSDIFYVSNKRVNGIKGKPYKWRSCKHIRVLTDHCWMIFNCLSFNLQEFILSESQYATKNNASFPRCWKKI